MKSYFMFHVHEVPGDCRIVSMTWPSNFFAHHQGMVTKVTLPWAEADDRAVAAATVELRKIAAKVVFRDMI